MHLQYQVRENINRCQLRQSMSLFKTLETLPNTRATRAKMFRLCKARENIQRGAN